MIRLYWFSDGMEMTCRAVYVDTTGRMVAYQDCRAPVTCVKDRRYLPGILRALRALTEDALKTTLERAR